jgi:hypothetical protein
MLLFRLYFIFLTTVEQTKDSGAQLSSPVATRVQEEGIVVV